MASDASGLSSSSSMNTTPHSPIHTERKWAPSPTTIEEAATLLGASITRINNELIYRTIPSPPTLHSSFATINPVPCSELYVRLKALTYILEQHLADECTNSNTDSTNLDCVVGIIPLLHKLLTLSSSLSSKEVYLHSSHETLPTVHPLVTIVSSAVGASSFSSTNPPSATTTTNPNSTNTIRVPPVKITPPLSSIPIRNAWVETLTLVHKLSPPHKLPSSNPIVLLSMYFEYAASHPKSSKSKGGVRVACLDLLGSIASDKLLAPKYTRAIFSDLVSLCNNGLKSSGGGDVMHRIASVNCLKKALMGWRDSTPSIGRLSNTTQENTFISLNKLDAHILAECVKLVKRACEDTYAEVREAGAQFTEALSSLLIPEKNSLSYASSSRKEVNALIYLDEILAICLRNLDDESVRVSLAWSEAAAMCMCTAVEYSTTLRLGNGDNLDLVESNINTGNSVSSKASIDVLNSSGKNDFASKFKAFNDTRKAIASIATKSCSDLESAVNFLVQHFAKVGGEDAVRMGGSHSMGGRRARIGLAQVLVALCRIQLENGGISFSSEKVCTTPSDILFILIEMVSQAAVEERDTSGHAPLAASLSDLNDDINDITLSPKRRNNQTDKGSSSMGSLLKSISGELKHKSPFDAALARLATNRVLRRGMSENMSEQCQLIILRDLICICKPSENDQTSHQYNRHQVQVALVEISNLVMVLGEACASSLVALISALLYCLSNSDHGVRHEAAVAFQSVAVVFPSAGRKYIMTAIGEIQVHYDEVLTLAATTKMIQSPSKRESHSSPMKVRRGHAKTSFEASMFDINIRRSFDHQYSIHGFSLLLSLVMRVLPKLPGALPSELLDIILAVADNLVSCQGNSQLIKNNPFALVLCVRSGYNIISGILSIGPSATNPNLSKIYDIWARSANLIDENSDRLQPNQSVSCLEPFISSIAVFLQHSSNILLSSPALLSKTTEILEKIFPVVSGYSQIDFGDSVSFSSTRLDSAKAAIMEAFLLLPGGISPLIAGSIFSFASRQIQIETKNGAVSTILSGLLSEEDNILDYRSPSSVSETRQCQMIDIEESLQSSSSNLVGYSEREGMIHFKCTRQLSGPCVKYGSVDELSSNKENVAEVLTSLLSSRSAKERLLNAAVLIFAVSFRFQGFHQQTSSITMLKELMISTIGSGFEDRCAVNVASTLLSCLSVTDTETAKYANTEKDLSWMVEAASTFMTLLPLPHGKVRRAAAEGLGLLANFSSFDGRSNLQSSILRSLENLMNVEIDQSNQQKVTSPTSKSTFAGCLFTFGCIQRARTAANYGPTEQPHSDFGTKSVVVIPTMIMLTRLLPHIATHRADEESFFCRVFALQSFYLLLKHSSVINSQKTDALERAQVLSKAIEIVESNFYSAWMTNSIDADMNGIEVEKMTFEPTLLAVLIRLMAYIIPHVHMLSHDSNVASRFSTMVSFMVEYSEYHPGVITEAFSFFGCLSSNRKLCAPNVVCVPGTHLPSLTLLSMSQTIFETFQSPDVNQIICRHHLQSFSSLILAARAFANVFVANSEILVGFVDDNNGLTYLFELLEKLVGSIQYSYFYTAGRGMSFDPSNEYPGVVKNLRCVIDSLVLSKMTALTSTRETFSLCMSFLNSSHEENKKQSGFLNNRKKSFRWQCRYDVSASVCRFLKHATISVDIFSSPTPFHLKDLLQIACNLALSSSDQSELYSLQKVGVEMIYRLIDCLSNIDHIKSTEFFTDHISLILPSVKQALSCCNLDDDDAVDKDGARELYLCGCKCLSLLYRNRMINDVVSLKRILKMLLPLQEQYSFSSYPKEEACGKLLPLQFKPTSFVDDRTSILLPRVSQLYTLSSIYLSSLVDPYLEKIFLDMIELELSLILQPMLSMCAALAIDGLRLKYYRDAPQDFILKSGLSFQKLEQMNETTKNTLIESCSSLSCFSLIVAAKFLKSPNSSSVNNEIKVWSEKMVSVVLSEFFSLFRNVSHKYDTCQDLIISFMAHLEALKSVVTIGDERLISTDSVRSVSKNVFAVLASLISIESHIGHIHVCEDVDHDVRKSDQYDHQTLIQSIPKLSDVCTSYQLLQIVSKSCTFVESVCGSSYKDKLGSDFLLRNLLNPIMSLETFLNDSTFDDPTLLTIVASSIRGMLLILSESSGQEQIIRALLPLSLKCYEKYSDRNDIVAQGLIDLFVFCFSCEAIHVEEKLLHISDVAKKGKWRIWELSVKGDLMMIAKSICFVTDAIADHHNSERHMGALTVVSNMMKRWPLSVPIFSRSTGPHILELFQMYGLNKLLVQYRTPASTICMKIIMLSFQYISLPSSKVSGTDMVSYLKSVFEVLVGIVLYNGLPNKETVNTGSDPSLGRLCAQFFVHVIKASPEVFKSCVGYLDEEVRLTLEAAVRADMGGYPKKKLSLVSFKKD